MKMNVNVCNKIGFIGFPGRRRKANTIAYYKRTIRTIVRERLGKCPRRLLKVMPMSYHRHQEMAKKVGAAYYDALNEKRGDIVAAAQWLASNEDCDYIAIVDDGLLRFTPDADLACGTTKIGGSSGAEYVDIAETIARALKVKGARFVLVLGAKDVMRDGRLIRRFRDEYQIEVFDMSGKDYEHEVDELHRIITKEIYVDDEKDVLARHDDEASEFFLRLIEQVPPCDPERTIDAVVAMDIHLVAYLEWLARQFNSFPCVINAHAEHAKRLAELCLTGRD